MSLLALACQFFGKGTKVTKDGTVYQNGTEVSKERMEIFMKWLSENRLTAVN